MSHHHHEKACACPGHDHGHQHGHDCACSSHEHHHDHGSHPREQLARIGICVVSMIALHFLPESWAPLDGWLRLALYLAVYLVIGWEVLKEAVEGIVHGEEQ